MFSIEDYIFSILRDVEIFQCASHKVYLAYRRESWNIMLEDPLGSTADLDCLTGWFSVSQSLCYKFSGKTHRNDRVERSFCRLIILALLRARILPFALITTVIFWRFIMRWGVSKVGGAMLILTYILFQALVITV